MSDLSLKCPTGTGTGIAPILPTFRPWLYLRPHYPYTMYLYTNAKYYLYYLIGYNLSLSLYRG
jgi:hypothetical protein